MPQIDTQLNPRSEDFKANAAAMQTLVDDLRAKVAAIAKGGALGYRSRSWEIMH